MLKVDFAFVWEEEQELLYDFAAAVPDNGQIVEIGTALGGTALLFHQAAGGRGVSITTVDLLHGHRAKSNLANTSVRLLTRESQQAAELWVPEGGGLIDLLYVDGDHSFAGAFEDYNRWVPLVRPGGSVVFHDYDPAERGGVAHLGVRIVLDTVTRLGLLEGISHQYKLFSGYTSHEVHQLPLAACIATLAELGSALHHRRELFLTHSVPEVLEILNRRTQPFDTLEACYLLDHALEVDFEAVDSATHDFYEFRRQLETLSFLEYAHGSSLFSQDISHTLPSKSLVDVSRLIASEQVRLNLLRSILATIVEWRP